MGARSRILGALHEGASLATHWGALVPSTTRAVRFLAAHRYIVARYAHLMASLRLACTEAHAYRENRHSTDQYEHLMAALAAARQEAHAYRKAQEEWLQGQGSRPK